MKRSPSRLISRLLAAALTSAVVVLAGCAGMRSITSDVSSYGEWPTERKAGSYAFERLPSQQARAAESDTLEASARVALQKAGFTEVTAGQQPDVLVQVGAADAQVLLTPWDDPLWWRGGFGYWRHGPWLSPRWSMYGGYNFPRYERQVAVLLRDRASSKPLFEARASSEGNMGATPEVLSAMFQAALADFPRLGINPRRVSVALAAS